MKAFFVHDQIGVYYQMIVGTSGMNGNIVGAAESKILIIYFNFHARESVFP